MFGYRGILKEEASPYNFRIQSNRITSILGFIWKAKHKGD